ncbi:PadR family transcriptional regulator [Novosphingobium sp. 1949]|uniref:PadR family transcriptional regulator n=2 Tax=Novosphingobium organovorum TaxID=2930092 RepID=A0ABT0B7X0_9SPHN|nr:PadR family transcriptional regulator [Novosphingobium organovorum]
MAGGFGGGFPGGHRDGGRGSRGFAMGPRGFDDDFGAGFGGGRGGGRGPGGGGRRRRVMDQSELQIVLLELIAETPRHGYDLIREIESMTNGEYAPSPGVVYPALTYMEEAGLIAAVQEDGARKSFAVTEEGKARVAQDASKAEAIRKRLVALGDVRGRLDPAPVRRALHALRTAVIDRLSQDGADRDLVLAIADTLDEATRTVERLEAGAQAKGTGQ